MYQVACRGTRCLLFAGSLRSPLAPLRIENNKRTFTPPSLRTTSPKDGTWQGGKFPNHYFTPTYQKMSPSGKNREWGSLFIVLSDDNGSISP